MMRLNCALRDPLVHTDDACVLVETRCETNNLTIVATLQIRRAPGGRVDHDHDHSLREFMGARDE